MSTAPWSLHLLSEVLAAFTVQSPTALRDVVSRVAEAVDAEITAIVGAQGTFQLCVGLEDQEKPLLAAAVAERLPVLSLGGVLLHLYWAPLDGGDVMVVGRFKEDYTLEERALLRAMGRSIQLSTQVLAALRAEQEALRAEKEAKDLAIREATIDALTGLPNRRSLLARLGAGLALSSGEREQLGLLFIDLDRFKHINDVYGHSTGDAYLQAVGEALGHFRDNNTFVGRLAGDEFIVIVDHTDLRLLMDLAERILKRLDQPWMIGGRVLHYSASIGVALADSADRPQDLLDKADLAMYSIKQQAPGRYACFEPHMLDQARRKADLETEIRSALRHDEVISFFQPIISAAHGGVVGFEGLARWHHPGRGLLAPEDFIEVAEEAGLLRDLDARILHDACFSLTGWQCVQQGFSPRLSINLSAASLQDYALIERVADTLAASGFEASNLLLEVTETSLVRDVERAQYNIVKLKNMGVKLAVDDFGTGYSSLRYLRQFQVGMLKIDRSFVSGLGQNHDDDIIVETIIRMAASLGIQVVAEGVETADQCSILAGLGCDFLQGFLLGRPLDSLMSERLFARSERRLLRLGPDAF
jgi:diguanylate cyclase (GGDEF)-like protein